MNFGLNLCQHRLHQRLHIQRRFSATHFVQFGACFHALGFQQGASVILRQNADIKRANAVRLVNDFLLIHANQGAQHRHGRCIFNSGKVFQRLAGDLS